MDDKKIEQYFKKAPVLEVPPTVWKNIAAQTVQAPKAGTTMPWRERLAAWFEEWSWGGRVAFPTAMAFALALLIVWGTWDRPHTLPVVELAANPMSAFPSYFREHNDPASQPISDGAMVLAFNTLRDIP